MILNKFWCQIRSLEILILSVSWMNFDNMLLLIGWSSIVLCSIVRTTSELTFGGQDHFESSHINNQLSTYYILLDLFVPCVWKKKWKLFECSRLFISIVPPKKGHRWNNWPPLFFNSGSYSIYSIREKKNGKYKRFVHNRGTPISI